MNIYKYNVSTIEKAVKIISSFFSYGEVGNCLYINFTTSDCLFQHAITSIENGIINFEFGLPVHIWSEQKINAFYSYFEKHNIEQHGDKNKAGVLQFIRAFISGNALEATQKSKDLLRFFIDVLILGKKIMIIKAAGSFYNDRLFSSIDSTYTDLEKVNQIGSFGKFIYKLMKTTIHKEKKRYMSKKEI